MVYFTFLSEETELGVGKTANKTFIIGVKNFIAFIKFKEFIIQQFSRRYRLLIKPIHIFFIRHGSNIKAAIIYFVKRDKISNSKKLDEYLLCIGDGSRGVTVVNFPIVQVNEGAQIFREMLCGNSGVGYIQVYEKVVMHRVDPCKIQAKCIFYSAKLVKRQKFIVINIVEELFVIKSTGDFSITRGHLGGHHANGYVFGSCGMKSHAIVAAEFFLFQ